MDGQIQEIVKEAKRYLHTLELEKKQRNLKYTVFFRYVGAAAILLAFNIAAFYKAFTKYDAGRDWLVMMFIFACLFTIIGGFLDWKLAAEDDYKSLSPTVGWLFGPVSIVLTLAMIFD